VEIVRVVGEDKDATEYELKDGETYVSKAGPEPYQAFSVGLTSTEEAERKIESNLRETIDLCERDVQRSGNDSIVNHEVSVPVPVSEQEDDGTQPMPIDSDHEREAAPLPSNPNPHI
jgi:hypothetical protein